ncbi:hypothetical protein O3Q51_15230 [Cryomorphaceae bacterium 1068]|nr:hypothetical protein [Cryomorphaceae bacterium 1068]
MELETHNLGIGARVKHPTFGEGIVVDMDVSILQIFFKGEGDREISRSFDGLEVLESPKEVDESIGIDDVKNAMKSILKDFSDLSHVVDLGEKWDGGKMVLVPGNTDLQSKEIPIDTFFHKIVMVRDRLRVLEQNINSHDVLTDSDKVHLQQYISRIYGSLTTFNVLFAEKKDHFSSK